MDYWNLLIQRDKEFTQAPYYRIERQSVVNKQAPFAIIFSCSDSREPPELIFNADLGELFVVRTAGHVLDNSSLASLEYAVEHLDPKVLVVLGHESCGAVAAALDLSEGKEISKSLFIKELAHNILDGIKSPKTAIEDNVRATIETILYNSKIIRDSKILIIGAVYNLHTGLVNRIY